MPDAPPVELHGDVKSFLLASAPVEWIEGVPADPLAQGIGSLRLKATAKAGSWFRAEVHWANVVQTGAGSGFAGVDSGVGRTAPELVPLTWSPDLGSGMSVQSRVDRLVVSVQRPGVTGTIGRQPISFGSGRVFAPLDLVNPFSPAVIDTEYKPGVDAIRLDGYFGTSGTLTGVLAYGGQPRVGADAAEGPIGEDLIAAMTGGGTVGVTDLGGFAGVVHGEPVVGATVVSAIGPVGLHGDAAVTFADTPFVRAVAGADWRPGDKTTLTAEVYGQSFGAGSPDGYLAVAQSERFARGEVWTMGQIYATVGVAHELTPLVAGNLAVIGNLRDPSALLAAGGTWSVADEAVVAFGAYAGIGERPDPVAPDGDLAGSVNSEFGLYPVTGYVQMRAYF